MRLIKYLFMVYAVLFFTLFAEAQNTTSSSGGSIQTPLGYGTVLNEESSLTREWITIHDDNLPINIVGTVGLKTWYQMDIKSSSGKYEYNARYEVVAKEDVVAFEIRFLTFNIWGEKVKTLSATEIMDLPAGTNKEFFGIWNLLSENEASEFYASIAYIAKVRTKTGKVYKANSTIIVQQAQKYSSKFSESDLEKSP